MCSIFREYVSQARPSEWGSNKTRRRSSVPFLLSKRTKHIIIIFFLIHCSTLLIHSAGWSGSDHYFRMRTQVPTFQNRAKQNNFQMRIVIDTDWTVSLAERITHDSCLVFYWAPFPPLSLPLSSPYLSFSEAKISKLGLPSCIR